MRDLTVLGLDPAPSKQTAVWSPSGLTRVEAANLRGFIEGEIRTSEGVVLVWDSPLTFDPRFGFSDRPFDRAARSWRNRNLRNGRLEKGAVSVLPFSGCPHWVVSCHVLGLPFGEGPKGLRPFLPPFDLPDPGEGVVLETHPAVALAALWIESDQDLPFPIYKGGKAAPDAPAEIAGRLGFPSEAGEDDDALDSFMAFSLGEQLLKGEAALVGDPRSGSYLLPSCKATSEMSEMVG